MNSGGRFRGPSRRRPTEKRPAPGRRPPPPAATGLEAKYLEARKVAGTVLEVCLRDGRTVRGVIEQHDRETIKTPIAPFICPPMVKQRRN